MYNVTHYRESLFTEMDAEDFVKELKPEAFERSLLKKLPLVPEDYDHRKNEQTIQVHNHSRLLRIKTHLLGIINS